MRERRRGGTAVTNAAGAWGRGRGRCDQCASAKCDGGESACAGYMLTCKRWRGRGEALVPGARARLSAAGVGSGVREVRPADCAGELRCARLFAASLRFVAAASTLVVSVARVEMRAGWCGCSSAEEVRQRSEAKRIRTAARPTTSGSKASRKRPHQRDTALEQKEQL